MSTNMKTFGPMKAWRFNVTAKDIDGDEVLFTGVFTDDYHTFDEDNDDHIIMLRDILCNQFAAEDIKVTGIEEVRIFNGNVTFMPDKFPSTEGSS